nr:hypothetical protein [Glycomyces sp. TRM65418]QZD56268.1 hypothetical protein K3N28_03845 [Glycomyces sp. TRM65418]
MVFEFEALRAGDREGEAVDPPRLVGPAVFLQPGAGEAFDAVELLAVDRAQRAAVAAGAAGLDLAEDDGVGGPRDEVEFAEAVSPVAGEELHPVALEVRGGQLLAEPAELVRAEPPEVHAGPGCCRWAGGRRRPRFGRGDCGRAVHGRS